MAALPDIPLAPGEEVRASLRAFYRNVLPVISILTGVGVGISVLIATSGSEGVLRAALVGAIGGAIGVAAGFAVAALVIRPDPVLGPTPTVLATDRRLVVVRRSLLTGRPGRDIAAEVPLGRVADVEVGDRTLLFTRPVTVWFDDGSAWRFDVGSRERPLEFAAAAGGAA